jgi:hypothetical protein
MHDELLAVAVEREVADAGDHGRRIRGIGWRGGGEFGASGVGEPAAIGHRGEPAAANRVESHHVLFGPLSKALRGITGALGSARLWLLLPRGSVAA